MEKNGGGHWLWEQVRKRAPAYEYNTTHDTRAARIDWMASELLSDRWTFRRSQKGQYLDDGSQTLARNLALTSAEDHLPDDVSALLVGLEHLRSKGGGVARVFNMDLLRR